MNDLPSNQFSFILLNDIGGPAWEMSSSPGDLKSGSDSFKAFFCFQMIVHGGRMNVYLLSVENAVENKWRSSTLTSPKKIGKMPFSLAKESQHGSVDLSDQILSGKEEQRS